MLLLYGKRISIQENIMNPDNSNTPLIFGSTIFSGRFSWWLFTITLPASFVTYLFSVVFASQTAIHDSLFILLFAFEILAFIAALLLYIVWMFSSNKDLRRSGMDLKYSPYWSVFGYIVPFISLWFPYAYTAELYKATKAIVDDKKEDWKSVSLNPVIPLWWISFLAFTILSRILPDEILEKYALYFFVLMIFATVFFLWSIKTILTKQIEVDNQVMRRNLDEGNSMVPVEE